MRVFWFLSLAFVVSCTDKSYTPTVPEAAGIGRVISIFAATTRQKDDTGYYGYRRSEQIQLSELSVSVPPSHRPGQLKFGYSKPDPYTEFTMANRTEFKSGEDFLDRIRQKLRALPPSEREVTVFVHGYNATHTETAFRAAQMANDIKLPGAVVIYSWPSQGKALGYVYDNDSMLFARDGLEILLRSLKTVGAGRVLLVGHSMGGALSMETLRQIEIGDPGWSARNLAGVVLISPDIDVQVFRSQMLRMSAVPKPFVVFVSSKDKALGLSSVLRGSRENNRLGNIQNVDTVQNLPINIIDTTAFSNDAESSHFVAVTSPALLAMMNGAESVNDTFYVEQRRGIDNFLSGNTGHGTSAARIVLIPR